MLRKGRRLWVGIFAVVVYVTCGCKPSPTLLLPSQAPATVAPVERTITVWTDQYLPDTAMDSPVWQQIGQQCGVKLHLVSVPEQPLEAMQKWLSEGKLPDVVSIQDRKTCAALADAGVLLNWRQRSSPNLSRMLEEVWDNLGYGSPQGPIYYLPTQPAQQHALIPESGFQLQHRVVKALGYPAIRTLEDYETALRTYLAEQPETNGQPTLGMTFNLDTSGMGLVNSVTSAAARAAGVWGFDGEWWVDPETGRATFSTMIPETKPYYQWLNQLFWDGLIDPEACTQSYESYQEKLTSGRVLGLTTFEWELLAANYALELSDLEDYAYGMYPVTYSQSIAYRDMAWCVAAPQGDRGVAATSESGAQFLEAFAATGIQHLWFWGVESQDYQMRGGQPVLDWVTRSQSDFAAMRGVGLYEFIFPSYGVGATDESGALIRPQDTGSVRALLSDAQLEVLEGYGVEKPADFYTQTFDQRTAAGEVWPMNVEDPGKQNILNTLRQLNQTYIAQLIQGSPEEFDATYEAWQQALRAAGAEELASYQTDRISKLNRDSQSD